MTVVVVVVAFFHLACKPQLRNCEVMGECLGFFLANTEDLLKVS